MVGKQPIVLLKTADGNRFLPIWIGHPEAAAILVKLQNAAPARPMTHDLLNDVLGHLDAEVVSIAVTEMRENTYYARITIQQNGSEIEIDSRPSDAIALAVRAGAKIFVADEVIDESGVEFEGDASDDEIAAAAGVPPLAELDPGRVPRVPRFGLAGRVRGRSGRLLASRRARVSSARAAPCRSRATRPPTADRGSRLRGAGAATPRAPGRGSRLRSPPSPASAVRPARAGRSAPRRSSRRCPRAARGAR